MVQLVSKMQAVAKKPVKVIRGRELGKQLKADPVKAKGIVEKVAFSENIDGINMKAKLMEKGVFTKVKIKEKVKVGNEVKIEERIVHRLDYDKLESVLSKDSVLRDQFYTLVGKEAKKSGLAIGKLSEKDAGEIVTKMGIRTGKIDMYLTGSGFSVTSASEFNKLASLGDDLANKFTKGNFSVFVRKYSEDAGFREKVHEYLQVRLANDAELSSLNGVDKSQLVSAITTAKGIMYTRRQAFKDAAPHVIKGAVKGLGQAGGQMMFVMGSYVVSATALTVMQTAMPQSAGAYWATMEATQVMRQMQSLGNPMHMAGMETQRRMMEQQGVMVM